MIYIISSLAIFFLILFLFLFLNYSKLKVIYSIQKDSLLKFEQENSYLNIEKIELLQKIENLSTSLKIQEESKEESLKNSKAVLYDLSNSVASKLIDIHKKEVDEARKNSEEKIIKSTENFNSELQKIATLIGSLNKDVESSKAIVDSLKSSLLSPTSAGALAEITLENILKNSGLKQDIDFVIQYSFEGTDKNKLRPDALVFLPEDKAIIIDAKSSKFLVSEANDFELAKSMNSHLKTLLDKDYTSQLEEYFSKKQLKYKKISTIMFLPTESSLEKLSNSDKNFMINAWQNNVYPVGPAGLMNILAIARIHISEKLRSDNYELIINEINSLINTVSIIAKHSAKIGNSIYSAMSNYDKFAASFNKGLISKVQNLKNLGTGSKDKPCELLERYQVISAKNEPTLTEEEKYIELKDID